ncbi:transporter [Lithospermum erythrorhizon]|uniref:Transporter n=1 Tax=Lithospermum erythrorhizon TaxID=34254 RepID=A0AAV3PET9_LITER
MAGVFSRKGCNTQSTLYNLWKQHQVIRNQKLKQPCKEYSRPPQSFDKRPKKLVALPAMVPPASLTLSQKWVSNIGVFSWYLGMVKTWPVVTKGITCGLIYTAADLTSQKMTMESGESYDLVRTTRMAGLGFVMIGPSLHYWFNFVAKLFPCTALVSTLKKMFLAQITYAPIMTALFFAANAALQGETGKEILGRLKRDTVPVIISGSVYWPICDFFTLKFFPVYLQPLGSNVFSYIWSVYTTYMASLEKVQET